MLHLNQRGLVDLQVLMIVLVVVFSGGFLTFRLSTSDDNQGSSTVQQSDEDSESTDTNAENEAEATEVENEPLPEDTPDPTQTVVNTNQNTSNVVSFTKGGISPLTNGRTVDISSTMSGAYSGTCTYTFTLGNTSVSESNQINNSNTCARTVQYTLFPKSGQYQAAISFVSFDGSVTADIDGLSVNIVPEEFSFTKGGGNWDGDNVFVSQTSADPHTGTCTFIFTNGSSTVETSTTISNSKTCETTVPGTSFPNTGNWLFDLSFAASDALITGSGGGFEIEIN